MTVPISNSFKNKSLKYLKSPLNYTGGKYRLLDQILPYFPDNIGTFVDLFSGGCNVCINVKADKILANDIDINIINLYRYFKKHDIEEILFQIDETIFKYGLSQTAKHGYSYYNTDSSIGVAQYNRESFLKLRDDYNHKPNEILFYTMIIFSFNNQIRFNRAGKFNLPVNKRDFTKNMRNNLIKFVNRIQQIDIEFISKDFNHVQIEENSFVYVDPPYFAGVASYNENGGWNEQKEHELLSLLDRLDARGIRFALSNVLENKGRSNELLSNWCKRYNTNYLNYSYGNCNYQAKNRNRYSTIEVLVTNF